MTAIKSRSYAHIHIAVQKAKGKASEHLCVDCTNQARDWSLRLNADPYDTDSYDSRCRSCHKMYDRSRQKISDVDILEIRQRVKDGESPKDIAYIFDISHNYVNKLARNGMRTYYT